MLNEESLILSENCFSDDSKDSAIEDDLWRFETVRGHSMSGISPPPPEEVGTLRLKPSAIRQDILPQKMMREDKELSPLPLAAVQRSSSKLIKEKDAAPAVKRPVSMPPVSRTPEDMPPPLPAKQRNSSLKVLYYPL